MDYRQANIDAVYLCVRAHMCVCCAAPKKLLDTAVQLIQSLSRLAVSTI